MKALLLILAPVLLLPCWMATVDEQSALRRLQVVQNAAARLLTGKKRRDHISPVLASLRWLPVHFRIQFKPKTYPLDMVPDAVDDTYEGCRNGEMEKKVNETYLQQELGLDGNFKKAWTDKEVEKCSKKKPDEGDEALTVNHMHAICAYTSPIVYKEFNKACKSSKDFKFYTLHYWLTTAIQILNKKQTEPCLTTYRRNGSESTGKVGDIIRFGIFASSSKNTGQKDYGTKTCFQIHTCLGAYLKHYPFFETKEEEVLIPPYEQFKITTIIEGEGKFEALPDCEKVFVLESAGKENPPVTPLKGSVREDPDQEPKPPQLAPFHVKEQRLYS
ncbi:T-cell ecto-ADP-ribosyltransferase 1-like [Scomber scombrus]|uniref:T-cell ecto-ADP-ribosyltransferase 1-like n=1 Tax=Scomber scombrus TaxID=13677 RepID=UPI002DD7D8FE|nr:T-cell ecto-ADP-ribosyltransferase 1-like [Scomber scombrus]